MRTTGDGGQHASPIRLLEMLSDRFGAFEALAYASLHIARTDDHENQLPMSRMTADAVLGFGDDLRQAYEAWVEAADPISRRTARSSSAR